MKRFTATAFITFDAVNEEDARTFVTDYFEQPQDVHGNEEEERGCVFNAAYPFELFEEDDDGEA